MMSCANDIHVTLLKIDQNFYFDANKRLNSQQSLVYKNVA
jgi:hypothetical protein